MLIIKILKLYLKKCLELKLPNLKKTVSDDIRIL